MSIDQGGSPGTPTGAPYLSSGSQRPTEWTLVVLASTDVAPSASDSLRQLTGIGIGVTVVFCSTPNASAETTARVTLDAAGVSDVRILGERGARIDDLAPRAYLPMSSAADVAAPDSLVGADIGEVAADIATVIALTGAGSVVLWSDSAAGVTSDAGYASEDADPGADSVVAGDAARRAARVMAVPVFVRELADAHGRPASGSYPPSVTLGGDRYLRDDRRPSRRPFSWRDQGVWARIGACLVAVAIGVAAGALGTVTQAWTLQVADVDLPVGLIGGLLVTAALLTGLRLVFDARAIVLSAALGLLGTISLLSVESAGGSVLVPAVPASYVWVFGPVLIVLLVVSWPRLARDGSSPFGPAPHRSGR